MELTLINAMSERMLKRSSVFRLSEEIVKVPGGTMEEIAARRLIIIIPAVAFNLDWFQLLRILSRANKTTKSPFTRANLSPSTLHIFFFSSILFLSLFFLSPLLPLLPSPPPSFLFGFCELSCAIPR